MGYRSRKYNIVFPLFFGNFVGGQSFNERGQSRDRGEPPVPSNRKTLLSSAPTG